MTGKLRPKYMVYRSELVDGEMVPDGSGGMISTDPTSVDAPFVLMPRKDPAAFAAMMTYMNACEPELQAEIRDWLRLIAEAEPKFGTQGKRNYSAMRSDAVSRVD